MTHHDEFDDNEGFLNSILSRKSRRGVHPGSLRRVLAVTAGLAILGVLAAVVWSTWPSRGTALSEDAVPLVQADATPYKTTPAEPGGMAVPNKDSTIFNTLKGQPGQSAKTENLFDDGEKPVRKDQVFTAQSAPPAQPTDQARDIAKKMPDRAQPVVTYESPDEADAAPPVDLKSAPVKAVPSQVTAATPLVKKADPVAEKAGAVQPAAGGNFYVQMASVKSEGDAKAQWPKYQAQYPTLVGMPLRVQKAELPKGTFYRIQAGPLAEADARKACVAINAKKSGACVVAKR